MSRMITALEIESEYGVPASLVRSAIKRFQIEHQVINGLISIALQDAEPVIFDYYARQDSYTWQDVAKKMNASPANRNLRKLADSILPHYCLASGTYYPINDVDDVIAHLEQYHIRKYRDKYYYLEGGREDFYITNYFTISEFRESYGQKYAREIEQDDSIRLKLHDFSKIGSQLGKPYPVEAVNLFGFPEYMIPWEYMEPLMEDYYHLYTVKAEGNPYERYEKETAAQAAACIRNKQEKPERTLDLFDGFAEQQLSKTKNQMQRAKTLAALRRYLMEKLDKEIYLYKNEEIHDLIKNADLGQRENAELCLFLKAVSQECGDNCAFDVVLSPKREARAKSDQDFYTEEQWKDNLVEIVIFRNFTKITLDYNGNKRHLLRDYFAMMASLMECLKTEKEFFKIQTIYLLKKNTIFCKSLYQVYRCFDKNVFGSFIQGTSNDLYTLNAIQNKETFFRDDLEFDVYKSVESGLDNSNRKEIYMGQLNITGRYNAAPLDDSNVKDVLFKINEKIFDVFWQYLTDGFLEDMEEGKMTKLIGGFRIYD